MTSKVGRSVTNMPMPPADGDQQFRRRQGWQLEEGGKGGGEGGGALCDVHALRSCGHRNNKLDKPYNIFKVEGQGHVKKRLNAYCLLSCREHVTLIRLPLPTHCYLVVKIGRSKRKEKQI